MLIPTKIYSAFTEYRLSLVEASSCTTMTGTRCRVTSSLMQMSRSSSQGISPPCLQGGIKVGTGGELEVANIGEQRPLQRGLEVYRGA